MALEPVKVPQNVYVEDRIMGPITLRHLMLLGIGGGISYAIWALANRLGQTSVVATIISWTPLVIAAAFAFIKINDISLFKMLLLVIEKYSKSNVRTWTTSGGLSINFVTKPKKDMEDPAAPKVVHELTRLQKLSKEMEAQQKELQKEIHDPDMDEDAVPVRSTPLPVNPAKIQASGIDPSRSVDGIRPPLR